MWHKLFIFVLFLVIYLYNKEKELKTLKKRSGITCSEEYKNGNYIHFVNQYYIDVIKSGGGVPILLPIVPIDDIETQLQMIDGLIIIGGCDVNPLLYRQNPLPLLGETDYPRDCYEIALIQKASEKKMPMLGICRGIQVINVAFGGTLFQDLSYAPQNVFLHAQKERKEYGSHLIHIKDYSFLYDIFQEEAIVNSYHHQAIDQLGEGLQVVAYSDDQIIEAIEHEFLPVWGVQFHPESMTLVNPKMQDIFNQFIEKC